MSDSILKDCVLAGLQLLRSSAQLFPEIPADRRAEARVELKLTPLPGEAQAQPLWVLRAELICRGVQRGDSGPPWFEVVVMSQASYQPAPGAKLDFETFARGHMTLARQLYPLLQQRSQALMADLGLHQVRLPMDFIAQPQASSAGTVRVH